MNDQEREICTAPAGKLRVVHIDPRDHWPTKKADLSTIDEVKAFFSKMLGCEQEVMAVFNHHGARVMIPMES